MDIPAISGNFGDLLDPRFQKIFFDKYNQLPDMLPSLFTFPGSNGRDTMTWSEVGAFGDWSEFSGQISYDSPAQGYDTTSTPLEFVSGFQVARKLHDDDQFGIMDRRPSGLATAGVRTRQKHGARILNNAFSVDTFFYSQSEGVALCSNSHGTNASGVSTATGFDNLVTSSLSATAVTAARTQMVGFRGDRGERISVIPDELWISNDNYDVAYELVASMGKPDVANNNRNVHEGAYTIREWNYLTDTNNWFMGDSNLRADMLMWVERIGVEFAFVEDFDTLIAKWRGYTRYSNAWLDWRWALGAQVS
ncbi:Mu-like prophage major head subunit gpT family protein [Candidatus Pacearchaeota archaeon]|nr:Mu-like prophage major head subunit gpT family protein [Candidatus Pacearchaeota archaeon]